MSNYEETTLYRITPNTKKAVYTTEYWTNFLKNGKKVVFLNTNYWRYGSFEIELTPETKEEIEDKQGIILNNYGCSVEELTDTCSRYEEIEDQILFTKEEIKEIYNLLFNDSDDFSKEYNLEDEYTEDEILENNGWSMDDTIYGFECGCILEKLELA